MHALDVIFWIFFASVAAFIGWTFIRLFTETLWDRRSVRKVKRPIPSGNAGGLHATTGRPIGWRRGRSDERIRLQQLDHAGRSW